MIFCSVVVMCLEVASRLIMNCEGDVKFRVSGAFVVNTNFELDRMDRGLVFRINGAGTGIWLVALSISGDRDVTLRKSKYRHFPLL